MKRSYRQQISSGQLTDTTEIERLFGRQGLDDFIDLGRGVEDAQETLDASVLAIETESRDLLTSIDANIALLTEGQLPDATTATDTNSQQQTATLESETAMVAAETTATQMATAEMESATAAQYATIVETLDPAVGRIRDSIRDVAGCSRRTHSIRFDNTCCSGGADTDRVIGFYRGSGVVTPATQ